MPDLLWDKRSRKVSFSRPVEEGTDVPRHLAVRSLHWNGFSSSIIQTAKASSLGRKLAREKWGICNTVMLGGMSVLRQC
jgi:hypothetical protein